MKESGSGHPSPKERISGLLKRRPEGPDFTQSTISYCDEVVETVVERVEEALASQYPDSKETVRLKLQDISHPLRLGNSEILVEGEKKFLKFPGGKRLPLNRLLESVYAANPNLVLFEYGIALYPPPK